MAVKETRREGSKRGKKGSQKGGRRSKKGRAVAKRVGGAFPRNRRVTVEAKRRVAGGEDWGGSVRDSCSTLVAGSGTGQLGRTGRRVQKQERSREGRRGIKPGRFYERGVASRCRGGAGEEEETVNP